MDELLKLLKENARETPENLARMLNQSVEEIQRRIQDYEKRGVIRGYQAVVNRDALDSDLVTAVIEVKVTPEREGGFNHIAKRISKGIFTWPGKADIPHAWAYLPDLAEAFVRLADKADRLPAFSHLHFAGHNVTGIEMHAAAEKALGRKLKRAALPGFLLSLAGLFSPMMRETKQVFHLWQKPHRMDGAALEAVIGPLPHTPLDHAVRDALKALGHVKSNAARPSVAEARPA